MARKMALAKLKPGRWFRFPNDEERWIKVNMDWSTDGKIPCVSLQTGIHWDYSHTLLIYKINKT